MRKKSLTKDERKIQIINWFAFRIQHDNESPASSYEIAKGLGLSPSTHLNKIIAELVEDQALESVPLNRAGRWLSSRGYMLKKGTFQRPPKQKRALVINSARGTEQMEMF